MGQLETQVAGLKPDGMEGLEQGVDLMEKIEEDMQKGVGNKAQVQVQVNVNVNMNHTKSTDDAFGMTTLDKSKRSSDSTRSQPRPRSQAAPGRPI